MKSSEFRDRELVLIGTVHRDPDGAARLLKLLDREHPVAVAVEVSPYALAYRQRKGRLLQRRFIRRVKRQSQKLGVLWPGWGQIHAIQLQLLMPFEYRSARKYCRDTGALLSCLDSSSWSKLWIQTQWEQLLSSQNVTTLFQQPPENVYEEVRKGYQFAAHLLSDPGRELVPAYLRSWTGDYQWMQREEELARSLRRLYDRLPEGRLVYVGGWQHLLSSPENGTLYEWIEHLRPRRLLLSQPPPRP
ncbi:MAG: hypothetical protein JSU72_06685 [Deltaproteobacteria bacterium]|nr:MAG: hypothetical protein JSU72_06685 [Deltaproteobacteria bacterium]